jgi:serine/threonine protein kinase
MVLRPGETFGRYELAELLGRGAMGAVYSAYDTLLHRSVALKVLTYAPGLGDASSSPSSSRSPSEVPRILREARAAARITHPNAVSIYDVGEVDGVSFFAMELVVGRTLRSLVGDASISVAGRIRWLLDTARALGAAHRLGLVHRDVKPENVMVRDDGFVKVLDFGIAKSISERPQVVAPPVDLGAELAISSGASEALTNDGVVLGTPMYMAPEQIRGEALDGRADQFAWGVLAYELLSGRPPWEGSGAKVLVEILSGEAASLTDRFAEIPRPVDEVVRKALAKAPADRFATMELLIDALEPFAASASVSTAPSSRRGGLPSALHVVTWNDVFVLVDYGHARPADYATLGEIILAEGAKHRTGIGGLTIVPRDARPPSDEARVAIHDLLRRLGTSLRCYCWLVEGTGFHAAMVRGVLTGVRVLGRLPYESHVSSDMTEALSWIVQRLDGGDRRLAEVPEGARLIAEQRRRSELERPPRRT